MAAMRRAWNQAVVARRHGRSVLIITLCGLLGRSLIAQSPASAQQTLQAPSTAPRPEPAARIALGEPVELTLRDAIERALANNLDIRIDRYGLDVGALRISGARGFYDPQVDFNLGTSKSTMPTTSLLQGNDVSSETSSARTFGSTFTQNLPSGGSVNTAFTNARTTTSDAFSFINPLFTSSLTIGFQQPLLRGLFRNPTRHQLRILNLDSKITDAQFQQAVSEVVQQVEEQYWNLVYAQEAYTARQESRDAAVHQREQVQQKVEAGLLTPVALTSANAEVAMRDQDLIQAEVQIGAAQNAMKRLIAGGPSASLWGNRLVPLDLPQVHEPATTMDDAVQQAIARRPELQSLAMQVQQNRIDRDFLSWETKPQLNLSGSVASVGGAGQVFQPIYDASNGFVPIGRVPDPSHPAFGTFPLAWRQVFAFTYPAWSVGLDMQVPIFNRSMKAQVAQADVTRRQLEAQLQRLQEAVMVEVANAYDNVRLQRRAVDVAKLTRELSQQQVDGETARFDAGFTTSFELLRYQRDLGDARVRELRATIDYQLAITALQKAMGVIVDDHDLLLAKHR
jgi:outer membrane protein TolC